MALLVMRFIDGHQMQRQQEYGKFHDASHESESTVIRKTRNTLHFKNFLSNSDASIWTGNQFHVRIKKPCAKGEHEILTRSTVKILFVEEEGKGD